MDICGVDLLFNNKYGFVCCEVNNTFKFDRELYDNYNIEKYIGDLIYKKIKILEI